MVHYIIYAWPYMYFQHLWKIGPDLQIQQCEYFPFIFRAEALSSRSVFAGNNHFIFFVLDI
jgi:hypothetical protein